jgi:hypothetical protein
VLIRNLLGDPKLLYAAGNAITFPLAAWWHDRPELGQIRTSADGLSSGKKNDHLAAYHSKSAVA